MQLRITPNPDYAECADAQAPWFRFLADLAAEIGPSAVVELAFVDDETMRQINRRYRGKDAATDVLSFTYGSDAAGAAAPDDDPEGEILIAVPTARRQAAAAGHGPRQELSVLAIHGLYHILGMDHEEDAEAAAMEAAEAPSRSRIALYFEKHPERS